MMPFRVTSKSRKAGGRAGRRACLALLAAFHLHRPVSSQRLRVLFLFPHVPQQCGRGKRGHTGSSERGGRGGDAWHSTARHGMADIGPNSRRGSPVPAPPPRRPARPAEAIRSGLRTLQPPAPSPQRPAPSSLAWSLACPSLPALPLPCCGEERARRWLQPCTAMDILYPSVLGFCSCHATLLYLVS